MIDTIIEYTHERKPVFEVLEIQSSEISLKQIKEDILNDEKYPAVIDSIYLQTNSRSFYDYTQINKNKYIKKDTTKEIDKKYIKVMNQNLDNYDDYPKFDVLKNNRKNFVPFDNLWECDVENKKPKKKDKMKCLNLQILK